MKVIADLQIHSRYARATSKNIDISNLEKYARIKGVNLLGTGDFTHPLWFKEIKENLEDNGNGIYKTKTGFEFMLQCEVSNIYSQDGKLRKIHIMILAASFEVVEQINEHLGKKGKIESDGRPIFGKYTSYELVEDMKRIDKKIEIIPAHIWTPWFSLFGANSGFDTVKECYKDQTKHIFALETGLSSDPAMNWRISQLDDYVMVSNSDAHSFWPWRLGREANVFDVKEVTYDNIINAMKTRKGFVETIEIDPNFGKYHYTGHRNCNVVLAPKDSAKLKNICPKCGRKLTVGVMERIEELADRKEGFKPKNAIPFRSLIPLSEVLATVLGSSVATQKTWREYYNLVKDGRSEYDILLYTEESELKKLTNQKIADVILKNRKGEIKIKPGYDGLYGVPVLDETEIKEETIEIKHEQKGLDEFY